MFDKRKNARILRKNIDKESHWIFSKEICQKVQQFITDKKVIMLYNAIDGEVQVSSLALLKNKRFIYPRVEDNELVAVESSDFCIGTYGILEPVGKEYTGKIDAIIVPMCAFDRNLNRLGFGKGFYDRFLKDKNCLKIGVAFSCQQTDSIQTKETDIRMDIIITEKEVLAV